MLPVRVVGGGPAGSSAALAALNCGAGVEIVEQSRLPRHKVCGEFLSPEVLPLLERLGVADCFFAARPAVIRRMMFFAGGRSKSAVLPEPAYGLSRYSLDHLLLEEAVTRGAVLTRGRVTSPSHGDIWAAGRSAAPARGGRVFGFKAHYEGPANDAVELYFFRGLYVGVSSVEGGVTNVCGLGPEEALRALEFDLDELVCSYGPLRNRLAPLRRCMDWLHAGPLVFENRLAQCEPWYRAGDALSFIDPFTGSGQLTAVLTGSLAGECAATGVGMEEYWRRARLRIGGAFSVSRWIRATLRHGLAEFALPLVPSSLLFRLTRPGRVA
jgi:flavin-dependent dehydrogenase